ARSDACAAPDLQRVGPPRYLHGAHPERLFRECAQGARGGEDPRCLYRAERAAHGHARRGRGGVRAGQSRPQPRRHRGDLPQPALGRGAHLPRQGLALPCLPRHRRARLPPRRARHAAGARRKRRARALAQQRADQAAQRGTPHGNASSSAREGRSKAVAIDGWTALNAYVPPKERRGLVLVDPAFEDAGDFARLAQALAAAHRKWASGIYLAWYPIKERAAPDALARRLRASGMAKILRAELSVAAPRAATRLSACGLIVINPPWTLAGELAMLLP